MEHGLRRAALAAAVFLVLTAGAASVEASPITVPINIAAGGSLTLNVDVNPGGLDLIGFDFGFSLPANLAITGLTAGPLLPSGSLAAFFSLPVNATDIDVFIVLASGFVVNTPGNLFSVMLGSALAVNGSLTFGPSTLDPLAASIVGSACDIDHPDSPECNIEFAARFDTNSQRILVDVAPAATEPVPEPATIALVGCGLAAAAWRRKRSTKVGQNSRQSFVVNSSLHKTKVF